MIVFYFLLVGFIIICLIANIHDSFKYYIKLKKANILSSNDKSNLRCSLFISGLMWIILTFIFIIKEILAWTR